MPCTVCGGGPVHSSSPTCRDSTCSFSGNAIESGGPAAGSPAGRWSSTTMRPAASRSMCRVRASRAPGVQRSSTSCASSRRPAPSSQASRWTVPPPSRRPLTCSACSGSRLPAQRRAVASEPSLPAQAHRAPSASASNTSKAASTRPIQRSAPDRRPACDAASPGVSGAAAGRAIRTRTPRSCAAAPRASSGRRPGPAASARPGSAGAGRCRRPSADADCARGWRRCRRR